MKPPAQKTHPMFVGARLTLTRKAHGLSQKEFAEKIGLQQNAYNQYERGKRLPRIDLAARICDEYNVDLDWIFRGDTGGLTVNVLNLLIEQAAKERDPQSGVTEQGQALQSAIQQITKRDFSG